MADAAEKDLPVANDYDEHNSTFEVFIMLIKWGTIATAVVLILMAIFLL